jgi:hypothetical protein
MNRIKTVFEQHQQLWDGQVPPGKGVPLVWDDQDPNWDPIGLAAEMLTRTKLSLLLQEIGPQWPLPCNGVLKFFQDLPELQVRNDIGQATAILSAGHDLFIQKTFEVWGIDCPELMVTDDDVRAAKYQLAKPDPGLLDLVHGQWLSLVAERLEFRTQDLSKTSLQSFLKEARQTTIYFGDDPIKDGQLAKIAGVKFGWYNPDNKSTEGLGDHFSFTDWRHVPQLIGLA